MPVEETTLEIHLGNLTHNFHFLQSKLLPRTLFMAVVKAAAYGNGAVEIALHLERLGIDYFAVAYTSEGVALRHAGIHKPILVLHPQLANLQLLLENRLEPAIYAPYLLDAFVKTARETGQKNYPIHLKFNTGLNRLGFEATEIEAVSAALAHAPALRVVSAFSHLMASEDLTEKPFILRQIDLFGQITRRLQAGIGYKPLYHLLNTSGILNYADVAAFDMVRSGIGLYGFGNDPAYSQYLKPIAELKTVIAQLHHIAKGESVGYSRAFVAEKPTVTATLPLGHADGIGRRYGNGKGFVTLHGKRAPIIGNVCMDMLMIDVTEIPCREGDEVLVFGAAPTAETLAEAAGTISYELITGISPRVKRVFLE